MTMCAALCSTLLPIVLNAQVRAPSAVVMPGMQIGNVPVDSVRADSSRVSGRVETSAGALVSARPIAPRGPSMFFAGRATSPVSSAEPGGADSLAPLSTAPIVSGDVLRNLRQPSREASFWGQQAAGAGKAPWWAPAASLVVPGAGQAVLRQQRSLAYLVAESFLIIQASRANKDLNSSRLRYQTIAADVARLQFGAERPPGSWDYYETLADPTVTSSGNFDLGVGGRFTPEQDETTYNGRQWLNARLLYWSDPFEAPADATPEYQKAIAHYRAHAVQGNLRWTWRDNQNAREQYVQSIKEANDGKQRLVSMYGLIAANHLLSLVDSYVTMRVRRSGGAGLIGATIRSELRPTGLPGRSGVASAINISMPIPGSGYRP